MPVLEEEGQGNIIYLALNLLLFSLLVPLIFRNTLINSTLHSLLSIN